LRRDLLRYLGAQWEERACLIGELTVPEPRKWPNHSRTWRPTTCNGSFGE
jgi:hypothetical protein